MLWFNNLRVFLASNKKQLILIYTFAICLITAFLNLNDFKKAFFVVPFVLTIILLRNAWDDRNQILSSIFVATIVLAIVTFYSSTQRRVIQKQLEIYYNSNEFKNRISESAKKENWPHNLTRPASLFNIYFIDADYERAEFSTKQLCSIESAAKNNHNARVNVFSLKSAVIDESLRDWLNKYENIVWLDFIPLEIFNNTPLLDWWTSGEVFKSKYLVQHTSDAARLALLWKNEGVYSDLTTITVKNFHPLIKQDGDCTVT
jgi:hypothetical protein